MTENGYFLLTNRFHPLISPYRANSNRETVKDMDWYDKKRAKLTDERREVIREIIKKREKEIEKRAL